MRMLPGVRRSILGCLQVRSQERQCVGVALGNPGRAQVGGYRELQGAGLPGSPIALYFLEPDGNVGHSSNQHHALPPWTLAEVEGGDDLVEGGPQPAWDVDTRQLCLGRLSSPRGDEGPPSEC